MSAERQGLVPGFIQELVNEISDSPAVLSIWLIGSRANGDATSDSDWDLLVFSSEDPKPRPQRKDGVDVLITGPSNTILLEGKCAESKNSFSGWEWKAKQDGSATYISKKFVEYPNGVRNSCDPLYDKKTIEALRLWPR